MFATIDVLNAMLARALNAAGGLAPYQGSSPQLTGKAMAAPNRTRPAHRASRADNATAAFRAVFNATASAGGHPGTSASAGDRDRRIASSVVNKR